MSVLIYGGAAFAVFVALALLHSHVVLRRPSPVPHLLGLWLMTGIVLCLVVALHVDRSAIEVIVVNLAVYLLPGEIFIFVYAAAVGSLSIRVLVTMRALRDRDAFERALAKNSPATFFDVRLDSLLAQGLIARHGDRYCVTTKGRRWARGGTLLKGVLAVGAGG